MLIKQIILAVKLLSKRSNTVRQHIDSKKVEVIDFARAKGTKLAGSYGRDHIHNRIFYGFRLHACVDDVGNLCHCLLRPANEHDISVAPRLLNKLQYSIVTADKGYISQAFKTTLHKHAVHLVTPRRKNQNPPPRSEQKLYKGHRIIETFFSSLDNLGLSRRTYRSNRGFVLHVYTTILAYQFKKLFFLLFLSRIGVTIHTSK